MNESIRFILLLPIRIIGIPLMMFLYIGVAIPLTITFAMDWAFDLVGMVCGFDTRYWPLPRAIDDTKRWDTGITKRE